jgi:hypothetical protein
MTVSASFCMSLDGFVARPDDSVGPLFDWYNNGRAAHHSPQAGGAIPPRGRGSDEGSDE